jgi:hypothetical protein
MSAEKSARSDAVAESAHSPALTIEFDTDAPVLNPGASRALLDLLLDSDRGQAQTNADKPGPAE